MALGWDSRRRMGELECAGKNWFVPRQLQGGGEEGITWGGNWDLNPAAVPAPSLGLGLLLLLQSSGFGATGSLQPNSPLLLGGVGVFVPIQVRGVWGW